MGGGFLIDIQVSIPQMTASVYFTPPEVAEFVRGMNAAAKSGTEG